MVIIGIDPGVETGLARWNAQTRSLLTVGSMSILRAMKEVETDAAATATPLFVIFEDARKRKGLFTRADAKQAKHGAGIREGIGSVKRDCSIWEEFLTDRGIPFETRYPHATKMKDEPFRALTKWSGRTNEHARDAAMIVFGLNLPMAQAKLLTFLNGAGSVTAGPRHRGSSARPSV